ncbi:hypothetical protein HJC23_008442 [Cyclotella cryptica]|uniref:Uncharacterized protein n=1 Tax=Cyclotella cryptica TaxID=29204 RepID=A0ABD3QWD5_9STRA
MRNQSHSELTQNQARILQESISQLSDASSRRLWYDIPVASRRGPQQSDVLSTQQPQSILKSSSTNNLLTKRLGKNCSIESRDGVPIITSSGADDFSPSLGQGGTTASGKSKKEKRSKTCPSTKSSASGGAPRYDWLDIETAAAIKVQSIYRRNKALKYLEDNGIFLFGDATLEDEKDTNLLEKKRQEKKKVELELEDAKKRKFRMRKKGSQHLEEGIEVVESFEEHSV